MKRIIISDEHLQKRIALVENNKIEEYYVETGENKRAVGSIFNGKIMNMEASLQAAFIDIGLRKNAFLHYWDMMPETEESLGLENIEESGSQERKRPDRRRAPSENRREAEPSSVKNHHEAEPDPAKKNGQLENDITSRLKFFLLPLKRLFSPPQEPKVIQKPKVHQERRRNPESARPPLRNKRKRTINIGDIEKKFSVGSEVIVQVTKGSIGTKGPRVTTNISLPGRYVVLLPNAPFIGISRRIDNRKERERLKEILKKIQLPPNMGLICRTAGAKITEKSLTLDTKFLVEQWRKIQDALSQPKTPLCIYQEPGLLESTIRDHLSEDIDEIVVDSQEAFKIVEKYVQTLDSKDHTKVILYDNPDPIFRYYNLHRQIQKIDHRKVTLPSGAELCLDETEALIAIDINSKKSRKGKDHPETILRTNLEAAEEICRQLRMRNVGGIIVIDFIDMRSSKDRYAVYQKMKEGLAKDRARTKILPISRMGLLEMTRQREYESLQSTTYESCTYCSGKGLIKSSITVSIEIQRRVQELFRRGEEKIKVTVHPSILARLRNDDTVILQSFEDKFGGNLSFDGDDKLHREEYLLTSTTTGKEI